MSVDDLEDLTSDSWLGVSQDLTTSQSNGNKSSSSCDQKLCIFWYMNGQMKNRIMFLIWPGTLNTLIFIGSDGESRNVPHMTVSWRTFMPSHLTVTWLAISYYSSWILRHFVNVRQDYYNKQFPAVPALKKLDNPGYYSIMESILSSHRPRPYYCNSPIMTSIVFGIIKRLPRKLTDVCRLSIMKCYQHKTS